MRKLDILTALLVALVIISPLNIIFQLILGYSTLYIVVALVYVSVFIKYLAYLLRGNIKVDKKKIIFFIWFYCVTLSIMNGIVFNGAENAFLGIVLYLLYPLLFFFLIAHSESLALISAEQSAWLIKSNFYAFLIVGGLAIYQYFIDPTLLGLYKSSYFSDFYSYSVQRASSILGSIQVFSSYCAFTLLSLYIFKPFSDRFNNFAILFVVGVGGLSGSQLFFALSVLVIFIQFFKVKIGPKLVMLAIIILCFPLISNLSAFDRVFSLLSSDTSYLLARNEGRFDIWFDKLAQLNLFTGNGIGSASILVDGSERVNTESYIINMMFEGGVILTFPFIVLLSYCIFKSPRNDRIVVLIFYISTVLFVHTLFSIFLVFPWLLLYLIYSKPNTV